MVVSFVGPNNFERTRVAMARLIDAIAKLIINDEACVFLFTNEGSFDNACWQIVSAFQKIYPDIRRIYARKRYENSEEQDIMTCYEEMFLLDAVRNAGFYATSVRNEAMVGMCDVLVTYCNMNNQQMPRLKEYEEMAVELAQQTKKRVINIYKK